MLSFPRASSINKEKNQENAKGNKRDGKTKIEVTHASMIAPSSHLYAQNAGFLIIVIPLTMAFGSETLFAYVPVMTPVVLQRILTVSVKRHSWI